MKSFLPLLAVAVLVISACGKPAGFKKVKDAEVLTAGCVVANYQDGDQWIINSNEELTTIIGDEVCTDMNVDFTTHTLLGQAASGSGCNIGFDRVLYRDKDECIYRYIVTVQESGACEKLGFSMNWLTVPKIEADCTIEFEVK